MKKILILFITFSLLISFQPIARAVDEHELKMKMIADSVQQMHSDITIAVLLYDGIVLQDFAGPMDVFSKAKNLTKGKYHVFTVAVDNSIVTTENHFLTITPDYSFATMPDADYLILPGASMPVMNALIEQDDLKTLITDWNNRENTKTVSICTAAYLLANSGVLNNKKATTHYFVADDFSKQFPNIDVIRDVRFVDEGKYITSSGVTSGIDVALYIVGQNSGEHLKSMIGRALQYQFHEQEDWPKSQYGMKYERKK